MKIVFLKFVLLLMFLTPLSELYGQYFGNEGTKWSYTSVRPESEDKIITLESIGTEEILGISCNVIQKTNSSCETSGHETNYVYYEEGQVFWYNEAMNNFTTLYDFNAEVGDSWDIHVEECTINVVIDSISFDLFNGETLKVLYPSQSISGFQNYRIIERLGLEEFMFPERGAIGCGPICEGRRIFDPIRCYEDDQFNYQSTDGEEACFIISSTNNVVTNFELSIYPTISTANFTIKLNGNQSIKMNEISLFDMNGIEHQNHSSINDNTIDLSIPNSGIYVVMIKLNNQEILTKKIIVLK